MEKMRADRMEANIANGVGSNEFRFLDRIKKVKRDEWEALIKVLVILLLIPFGILTFRHAFLGQYNTILFNNFMLYLLIIISILSTILYAFIIFPRSQEKKREETLVTERRSAYARVEGLGAKEDLSVYFTHILALIITVPLIVVACKLLVTGNRSEELMFISGLLGVIIGYYFGHRGVESADSKKDEAIKAAEIAKIERDRSKKAKESSELKNMVVANSLAGWDSDRSKKIEAWLRFREKLKKRYKEEEIQKIKNIFEYLPWEEPEKGWNDVEQKFKAIFEEESEGWAVSGLEEVPEQPPG